MTHPGSFHDAAGTFDTVDVGRISVTGLTGFALARRVSVAALGLGAASVILTLILGEARGLLFAYLTAFFFFASISATSFLFCAIQHVTSSGWSATVRRIAENLASLSYFLPVLFLPIVLGLKVLYPWARPEAAHDHHLHIKAAFLNAPFFFVRSAVYLLTWCVLTWLLVGNSRKQDSAEPGSLAPSRKNRTLAAPAILLYAITFSFASIDWIMSLTPRFFSTIFGVYTFAGAFVAVVACVTVFALLLFRSGPSHGLVNGAVLHDLGKLQFAFVVFWGYIAFSQYFLIWYGNLPEENFWYLSRAQGGLRILSWAVVLGRFVVPFVLLLTRDAKRHPRMLLFASLWNILFHVVDVVWLVYPGGAALDGRALGLLLACFLLLGGFAVFIVLRRFATSPPVAVRDPYLPEALRAVS